MAHVCTLLYRAEEFRKLHSFAVDAVQEYVRRCAERDRWRERLSRLRDHDRAGGEVPLALR